MSHGVLCNNARNYITEEITQKQVCNVKFGSFGGIQFEAIKSCNKFGLNGTILAEIVTISLLGTIIFVTIFVIITNIIPPEHFLCNVVATVCPCLQDNMRRNLLCKEIAL